MYKKLESLKNLKSKKVLLKLDLNLSFLKNGKVDPENAFRVEASLKTIKYLISKKAKIAIISYIGRPDGSYDAKYKMDKVALVLSKYLNKKVKKLNSALAGDISNDILKMKDSEVVLLENIRFYKEEMVNDDKMASDLAKLFDIYVNDAFSNAHREHMSACAISKYLPSYMGFRFDYEIKELNKVLKTKFKNAILIMGGAKADTKLPVISKLISKFDKVLVGGVIANNFLYSRNISIGKSLFEEKLIKATKKIDSKKIIIPVDVVVSKNIDEKSKFQIKDIKNIEKDDIILDIGPRTIKIYLDYIKKAKFILWNGPLGYFEFKKYRRATELMIKEIKKSHAIKYSGGGETVGLLGELKMKNAFNFISTGGGAMLEFLSGKKLPGITYLEKNKLKIK